MEDWNISTPIQVSVNVQGFDAATLNGMPGSFYLNAGNLTGTIDTARIPGLDWAKITTGKPTTIAGYGIADGYTKTEINTSLAGKQDINFNLTGISGLTGTAGIARKTAGVWGLDTSTYLTANQTITLSGDVSGSGTTAISVTLPNVVAAGSSAKPTYNAKGLITGSGSLLASDIPNLDWAKITTGKPTTLGGYAIVDAVTTDTTQTVTGTKTFSVLNASSFNGSGAGLTSLNASNLSSGTIPDARLVGNYSGITSLFRPGTTNSLILRGGNETLGSGAIFQLYGKDSLGGQAYLDTGAVIFRSLDSASSYGKISSTGIDIYASTIATSTTTGALTVNGGLGVVGNQYIGGFSSLGGDASHPAIKIKVLTGTTASTEGGTTSVAHGITASKIVSISVLVEYASSSFLPPSHNIVPGYYFDFYSDTGNVHVVNKVANSSNILSKQFKVTIIYTA